MKNIFIVFALLISISISSQVMPDTLGNADGWRYATEMDAAYWHNVNLGDVIIFQGASTPIRIDTRQYDEPISISGGQKIHIWRGKYERILLVGNDGVNEINSSIDKPVIITNLGGQVRWGENYNHDQYRSFETWNLKHIFLTGEYNPDLGTGDAAYLGLKGDLTKHGWIENFGLLADQKYTSFGWEEMSHGMGVKITGFLSAKVRGVAALHGYFSGFNIKNGVGDLDPLTIDIQYCLSGWHEGEGFYIGYNGSQSGATVSENLITLKNNVALFTGAEGIQVDFMSKGSVVKNNFVYKTACFYQTPFQGAQYQENGLQWSFTEGGINVSDNILYTGNAGNVLVGPRYKDPGEERRDNTGNVTFTNNLLGPSRRAVGYIFEGDIDGGITYYLDNNVIDSITVSTTNDAYPAEALSGFFNLGNTKNPIYLRNNIYPEGRSLLQYGSGTGANVLSTEGSVSRKAPYLLLHDQFGFDPKNILNFVGVWYNGLYDNTVTTGAISYKVGDMVYKLSTGKTAYYECIKAHSEVKDPETESDYWKKLSWQGEDEPTYTPLLKAETYYNYRHMGLELNPNYTEAVDLEAPVLKLESTPQLLVGDYFVLPQVSVSDNKDTELTYHVSFLNGKPQLDNNLRLAETGYIQLQFDAVDKAGNRAEPLTVTLAVSSCDIAYTQTAQLNLHRYGRANLVSSTNYWTDVVEDNAGVVNSGLTRSILKNKAGELLPWQVTIDDSAENTDSKHYGRYSDANAIDIGSFPTKIIEQGLALREGIETRCEITFTDLDASKYYDFSFTGHVKGSGEINIALRDLASNRMVSFNVINNTEVYHLNDIQPNPDGSIQLTYEFISALRQEGAAISSLAGIIIDEKTGFGEVSIPKSKPANVQLSATDVNNGDGFGTFIGKLSATGKPQALFSLVDKDDADAFYIRNDSLFLKTETNYETQKSYAITVEASNCVGTTLESFNIPVSPATGIFDNEINALQMYPNPVKEMVHIVVPEEEDDFIIEVFDIMGVKQIDKAGNKQFIQLDVSSLKVGVFWLRIIGRQTYSGKLIKE